jgi:ribosomal protein S18 acetylase RimI-like enzyme
MKNTPTPFDICPAQPSDAPAIVVVHQEAFVWGYKNSEEPEFGATEEALRAFVEGNFAERKLHYWGEAALRGTGIYVARLRPNGNDEYDEVVGVGEATAGDTVDVAEVTGLYVLPKYHQGGIGTALLQATVADLRQPTIRLAVTRWAYAAAFYKKRGFEPTGRPVPTPEPPEAYGITLEQMEMEMHQ